MSTEGAAHVECRSFGPPIARVLSTPHGGVIHCRAFSPVLAGKSCPGTASAAPVSREAGLARRERRALSGPDVRSGQQSQRACPATRERSGPELARDLRRCLRRSASQALAPESYCLVTDATPAATANARSCFPARRSPEAPPHAPRKPVSP